MANLINKGNQASIELPRGIIQIEFDYTLHY